VERILKGDAEAYRLIVERHQGRIFYLGLKFFHRLEEAEDFTQEVFLRAYERLGTYRGESPLAAWLYRLAFNLGVNRYRLKRRRLLEVGLEDAQLPDSREEPEREFLQKEASARVKQTLKELPGVYALTLKMAYFDGLSYPEISRITALPVNTIKSYIFRAKRLIRHLLKRHEKE